jgi:hypothetical protein
VDAAGVRRSALALPEVEEYEHGDLPAFRVHGKRFATMLDDEGVNLMLDEEGIRSAVATWPEACRERHVAGRLASVRVAYGSLPGEALEGLLEEAWARKAPRRLLRDR